MTFKIFIISKEIPVTPISSSRTNTSEQKQQTTFSSQKSKSKAMPTNPLPPQTKPLNKNTKPSNSSQRSNQAAINIPKQATPQNSPNVQITSKTRAVNSQRTDTGPKRPTSLSSSVNSVHHQMPQVPAENIMPSVEEGLSNDELDENCDENDENTEETYEVGSECEDSNENITGENNGCLIDYDNPMNVYYEDDEAECADHQEDFEDDYEYDELENNQASKVTQKSFVKHVQNSISSQCQNRPQKSKFYQSDAVNSKSKQVNGAVAKQRSGKNQQAVKDYDTDEETNNLLEISHDRNVINYTDPGNEQEEEIDTNVCGFRRGFSLVG